MDLCREQMAARQAGRQQAGRQAGGGYRPRGRGGSVRAAEVAASRGHTVSRPGAATIPNSPPV